MRLDLLLAREPFAEIFADTLGDYLRRRFGWQGCIRWRAGGGRAAWLANDKLNLIFPASCPSDRLRPLAAEYAYHPNPARRVLQGWYVRHAVAAPLRRPLACAGIDIDPLPPEMSDWCILAGNHALRIVDLAQERCVVLRKRGFREEFLDAVVDVRRRYPELPGPRLLECNAAEGWYAEERIAGLPLNRVPDATVAGRSLAAARAALAALYTESAAEPAAGEWVEDRLGRVAERAAALPPVYGDEVRGRVLACAGRLAAGLRAGAGGDGAAVPTALAHGDFQPANILVPAREADGPLYLIDWEYSARRCRWYDALVFALKSRFPAGLAGRAVAWAGDSSWRESLAWCGLGPASSWRPAALVAGFLLDDLLLRLDDTAIPGLLRQNRGFLDFLDELALLRLDN